jgi:hypothetical protein
MTTTKKHVTHLPFIAHNHRPVVKAGIAFSSHVHFNERVQLLGQTVKFWRGWAVFSGAPVSTAGLEPTPCLTRDFYYRPETDLPLDNQLRLLEYITPQHNNYLLFLNEPNESKFPISRAVEMYVHTRKVCPQALLVGPGISHIDYTKGFPWLREWIDAVRKSTGSIPQMNAWDIHNYMQETDPLAPVNALQSVLAEYGILNPKFFISEWGASTPQRTTEMKRAFDNDPRIVRHYWYDQYMATWDGDDRQIQLFVEDSNPLQLSDIGRAFISA